MEKQIDPKTGYRIEELLPIVGNLAKRYTSNDSSSVTYEIANQLMEAVIYTISEGMMYGENQLCNSNQSAAAEIMYEKGYSIIIKKTRLAKKIYHGIIENFVDFGCRNYADTIKKGIPKFFLWYDPVFAPQNHILTLDYPLMEEDEAESIELCGIDRILFYLQSIRKEQHFLARQDYNAVVALLNRLSSDYEELLLDNICDCIFLYS